MENDSSIRNVPKPLTSSGFILCSFFFTFSAEFSDWTSKVFGLSYLSTPHYTMPPSTGVDSSSALFPIGLHAPHARSSSLLCVLMLGFLLDSHL
jgi:hypothetical protein